MVQKQVFTVEGMSCNGCEQRVTNAVKNVEGVRKVDASHETGEVEVAFDQDTTSEDSITDAIHKAGYDIPA